MNNSNTNEAEQTQSVQPFLRVQVCGGDYIPMLVSICSPLDCCEGWELSGGNVWICKDGFSVTPLLFLAHVRTVEKQSCAALSPRNSNQSMSPQRVASLNTGQDAFICKAAYFSAWCSQLIAHPSRCCSPFSSRHVSYARTHAHKPGNTMQVPTGIWLPNKTTIHRSDQCFQGCSSSRLRKMGDNAALGIWAADERAEKAGECLMRRQGQSEKEGDEISLLYNLSVEGKNTHHLHPGFTGPTRPRQRTSQSVWKAAWTAITSAKQQASTFLHLTFGTAFLRNSHAQVSRSPQTAGASGDLEEANYLILYRWLTHKAHCWQPTLTPSSQPCTTAPWLRWADPQYGHVWTFSLQLLCFFPLWETVSGPI